MCAKSYLALCAGNQGLDDRASVIIQKVHLINDEKLHKCSNAHIATLQ